MDALNLGRPGGVKFMALSAPGPCDDGVIGIEPVEEFRREALDTGTKMPEPGTEVSKYEILSQTDITR